MGYSLVELMVGIAVTTLLMAVFSSSLINMSGSSSSVFSDTDVASYRQDLKFEMSRRDVALPGEPYKCMTELAPLVTPQLRNILSQLITDPTDVAGNTAKALIRYDLGPLNFINLKSPAYGSQFVQDTYLSNFRLLTSQTAYRKAQPGDVDRIKLISSQYIVMLVQADLHVDLAKKTNPLPVDLHSIKPVKVKFAILKQAASTSIVDCGDRNLSSTISQIQVCKSFGPDFEYIYDNFDGKGKDSGQCYAPIYDTIASKTFGAANGQKLMAIPTGYMPLRGFFCEQGLQAKGYLFSFCTGVN